MWSRCFKISRAAVLALMAAIQLLPAHSSDVTNMRLRKILDTSYDRDKAPKSAEGDGAITVQVNLHIRELLLNENDLTMSLLGVDVMQSWNDHRLAAVTRDGPDLRLYRDAVDAVWTPSLHVVNGREQTELHRSLVVSKAGLVLLQQRMSIGVLCPNFTSHMKPLVCSIQIQPYSNTETEVVYEWGSMTLEPTVSIPKYSLVTLEPGSCTIASTIGSYSCKQLSMSFRADVNFFATEVYGATFLLVALSWTGFWMHGSAASGRPQFGGLSPGAIRLGLGLVIVLILVVYSVGFRMLHNKVGVPGNVEVWVAFCTLFVLASLVEFVFVHILLCTVPGQLRHVCCKRSTFDQSPPPANCCCCQNDLNSLPMSEESASFRKAARVIDVTCGILFPVIFVLFNVAYWITY